MLYSLLPNEKTVFEIKAFLRELGQKTAGSRVANKRNPEHI